MHVVAATVTLEAATTDTLYPGVTQMLSALDAFALPVTSPQVVAVFALVLGPEESGAELRYQLHLVSPSGEHASRPEYIEQLPTTRPYTLFVQDSGTFRVTEYGCYEFRLDVDGRHVATAPLYILELT